MVVRCSWEEKKRKEREENGLREEEVRGFSCNGDRINVQLLFL